MSTATSPSSIPPYPIPRRRSRSLKEYHERNELFRNQEQKDHKITFTPKPTDVIVTPYGKSGTTWLQQIVHSLRTRGDMDFDDISRVIPWIEMAHILGQDLEAPQRGSFRAYKSHAKWEDVAKGGRYIVSIRDPKDVLVSMFRFTEGWFWDVGAVSVDAYAEDSLARSINEDGERTGHWAHIKSWWAQRNRENVLLLSYEQMRRDHQGTIRQVADFVDVELDDELLEIVLRQSSLDFMLKHKDKFDDLMIREHTERALGLPPGSDSAKVREGKVGSHKVELPSSVVAQMDEIWQEEITASLGFTDYAAFSEALLQLD